MLTPAHLLSVIRDYRSGALAARDVEGWAEALDGRDDVGYDDAYAEALREVVFELATPELFGGMETVMRSVESWLPSPAEQDRPASADAEPGGRTGWGA